MSIIIGISYYEDVTVILVERRPRMKVPNQLLKPLTEQLMKEVMLYGILEISTEQYQYVCNSILRFAESAGYDTYSKELMESYMKHISRRVSLKEICPEYHRRIIPAYSEEEICGIAESSDTDDALGKRDHAIILLAYCTGLRGIDIIGIRLSDIDWRNCRVSVGNAGTVLSFLSLCFKCQK